jgi:hypothetical protein
MLGSAITTPFAVCRSDCLRHSRVNVLSASIFEIGAAARMHLAGAVMHLCQPVRFAIF